MRKLTLLSQVLLLLYFGDYAQSSSGSEKNRVIKQNRIGQNPVTSHKLNFIQETFAPGGTFIENIGQYGEIWKHTDMGSIKYGYENMDMSTLFTLKGLIHIQRKVEKISRQGKEKLRQGVGNEEVQTTTNITNKVVIMEWLGANPTPEIIASELTPDYFTYGLLKEKARGYKSITYKNIYPSIDVIYTFSQNSTHGFEYSLIIKPGADLRQVKMKYGGDIEEIKIDDDGNLVMRSSINGIIESRPKSFTCEEPPKINTQFLAVKRKTITTSYLLNGNTLSFKVNDYFDKTKTFIIDPFVSPTNNLTGGNNAGKAMDVDFDYQGNTYVVGGGTVYIFKLAKYSRAGVLLWTFNGSTMAPLWDFGQEYGGWVVEKNTGKIYLGQGANLDFGTQTIRLNTLGIYDDYVTTQNVTFTQNWKMFWNCDNGSQQLFIGGGTTIGDVNFTVLEPPSTIVSPVNITGIPFANRYGSQDVVDAVIDPLTNDMYSIFASNKTPQITGKIFKHNHPYSSATIVWQMPSTYTTLNEDRNRPYMATYGGLTDNSMNILAVNSSYLFYWDGKNLQAFNKATGTTAGNPVITDLTVKMQGGIYADECNNVFIGYTNGLIKAYKFDGTNFNDAAAADIIIPGFSTGSVYDLAYNSGAKLLYACGNGFLASFDISGYCSKANVYSLNILPDCAGDSATVLFIPAAPSGTVLTYSLYNGSGFIISNTTGVFRGLSPATTYTVKATINESCGGIQAVKDFFYSSCMGLNVTTVNASCDQNNGVITTHASYGAAPYQYSKDGTNFQAGNVFPNLNGGNYIITVKDANLVIRTVNAIINTSSSPVLTLSAVPTSCSLFNGSIAVAVTGGTQAYQYSKDGANYQANSSFIALRPGNYTIYVKDATGCIKSASSVINSISPPIITATGTPVSCNSNNGIIKAAGAGGLPPYQFSKDGIIYQAGDVFSGLSIGTYTINIKDSSGCIRSTSVTLRNAASPNISASGSVVSCTRNDGIIISVTSAGTPPYKFSYDGINYQTSDTFINLGTGSYTIMVKDSNGCSGESPPVILENGPAPTISATAGPVSCLNNNGVITAIGSGGTAPYFYNLNGGDYQNSNIFSGLGVGNYKIYTKDSKGCMTLTPQSITLSLSSNSVTLDAGNLPSICEGVPVTLTASSNADSFSWSPSFGLDNPHILQPTTAPVTTTKYYITATIGICSKTDSIVVLVRPAPVADAGPDVTVCNGKNIQLKGIGGVEYLWSPDTYLSNATVSNPTVVDPLHTITYALSVKGSNGCFSTQKNEIKITVLPPAILDIGPDTEIVANQPLQLNLRNINNNAFTQFRWDPPTGLSSQSIPNPIAILENDISYTLTATTSEGCRGTDNINITVVKKIEIYVPNAFTPNSDGINDLLTAKPVGITNFKFFSIYNRWGKRVFTTNDFKIGWDGRINGMEQPISTFVWVAEGADFKGNLIRRKGTVTLIR